MVAGPDVHGIFGWIPANRVGGSSPQVLQFCNLPTLEPMACDVTAKLEATKRAVRPELNEGKCRLREILAKKQEIGYTKSQEGRKGKTKRGRVPKEFS